MKEQIVFFSERKQKKVSNTAHKMFLCVEYLRRFEKNMDLQHMCAPKVRTGLCKLLLAKLSTADESM